MNFCLNTLLKLLQCLVPAPLLINWNVVLPAGRKRAGSRRVHRQMDLVTAGSTQQIVGMKELSFGLSREPNDDVSGDGRLGHTFASLCDAINPQITRVTSAHSRQNVVITGLYGQVPVLANRTKR